MKTTFRLVLAATLLIGLASVAVAQAPPVTHNAWTSGAAMPTARFELSAGAIGKNIYVVDGAINSGYEVTGVNEIYDTKTNTWTTGASDPTARYGAAAAVVNGILYVIGGAANTGDTLDLVEAYDPATDAWTTLAPLPTTVSAMAAVVDKDVIYVIGGYITGPDEWLATVYSYNTTNNTWTEEAPLPVATAWEAAGLLGTTIVAADGQIGPLPGTPVGNTEAYNPKKNTWTNLTADATPRLETCFAAIKGQLYVAGGFNSTEVLNVNEAYNGKTKSWTTLAPMPNAVGTPASATLGGRLYCFGGTDTGLANIFDYVQIYQP